MLGVVDGCLGLVVLLAYHRRPAGIYPPLLLACALAALMIPATSHDYTLSYLAAPVAVFFVRLRPGADPRRQAAASGLLVLFSTAYAATLFSYTHKPRLLDNTCPRS